MLRFNALVPSPGATSMPSSPLVQTIARFIVVIATSAAGLPVTAVHAQATADPYTDRLSVVGGVSQLLIGGGNMEGTWYTRRLSIAYSHGFGLQLGSGLLPSESQDQQLQLSMPWTTGLGVGYRITRTFDVRVEVKRHRFTMRYDDQDFSGPTIGEYSTTTVGLGAYYRYYPFARSSGLARGLVLVPSVRYWPNVSSSLANNELTYANERTGRTEMHQAATQGFPGTGGLLANVSVGYTFGLGGRR